MKRGGNVGETEAREAGKLRPKSCGRSNNAAFEINMAKRHERQQSAAP